MQPIDATTRSIEGVSDDFWERYIANVQAKGVTATATRWYVIRAEQYLKASAQKRLEDHTPQQVTAYLEHLGRIGRMADWQYIQIIDAIQHVFVTQEVPWAQHFDWEYWKAAARTLQPHHPTIARDIPPGIACSDKPRPGKVAGPGCRVRETELLPPPALRFFLTRPQISPHPGAVAGAATFTLLAGA